MQLTTAQKFYRVGEKLGINPDAAKHYVERALACEDDVETLQTCVRVLYAGATSVYDQPQACYRVLAHADSSDYALGLGRTEVGAWCDAAKACLRDETPPLPAAGSPTQSLRSDEALWLEPRRAELAERKLTPRQRVERLYPRAKVVVEAKKGLDDRFGVWVGEQSLSRGYATELEAWAAAEENTRPPRRETVGGTRAEG